jgi:soluble lytic murein transglycosylase
LGLLSYKRAVCFRRGLGLAVLALVGCARPAAGDPVRPSEAPPAAAKVVEAPKPVLVTGPWVELLRAEHWAEALNVLDAEPDTLKNQPLARYAAAAAAEKTGDFGRSLELLSGLESNLPALSERVLARRARVALRGGNYAVALEALKRRTDSDGQLQIAEALAKTGDRHGLEAAIDTLLRRAPERASKCRLLAPAHRLLAEAAPAEPPAARARELRWLLTEAPLCAANEGAFDLLRALPAPFALKPEELLARARAFADTGRIEATEIELERVPPPARTKVVAANSDFLRGLARYQARRELERAVAFFTSAAARSPGTAAECLFYAARSCERAGDSAGAGKYYERLQRGFSTSNFADTAAYRQAQLAYSEGRFEAAARAYEQYLAKGSRRRFAADAREERAVSLLIAGPPSAALHDLETLARSASDPRERARYLELCAVANQRAGKKEQARTLFLEVIRDQPLSFAALMAAARLESLGQTAPAALPVASSVASNAPRVAEPPLVSAWPEPAESLRRVGLDREAESALGSLERAVTSANPGRGEQALCLLYGQLSSAERAYRTGQRAASVDELTRLPLAERRWLWDCVYPRPYAPLIKSVASEQGIAEELLYAVMRQESAFRPDAVSPAQASGLLQLMPSTAERIGNELALPAASERLGEPELNIRLGAHYLSKLSAWFDGNLALLVASYNAGPIAVRRWVESAPELELDLFVARIPYEETRNYVERVLSNYARYRYLALGEAGVPKLGLTLPKVHAASDELF